MSENEPRQPTYFTLGEAAKVAGVSKPTLSKAINVGRLSAEKQSDGSYRIQPAELFRVYPPETSENRLTDVTFDDRLTGKGNSLISEEVSRLRERLTILSGERERERDQLTSQIEDLRRRLDAEAEARRVEGEERRKLTAILTDQRQPLPSEPVSREPRGLWGRFRYLATGKI